MCASRENKTLVPMRYAVLALAAMMAALLYLTRVNLSVTIVAMTRHKRAVHSNSSSSPDGCPDNSRIDDDGNTTNSTADVIDGEFDWNQTQQGLILSAFFYGYILFQVIGGRLAEMWGGKWLCASGILASGLINLLTPAIARWGLTAMIVSRVILGAAQSVDFPAGYSLITRWFPEHELGTALGIFTAGSQIGAIVTMALSGYLSSTNFLGGWPSVFYSSGALACVWLLFWLLCVTSEPRDHRFISKCELEYIESHQSFRAQNSVVSGRQRKAPWLRIVTSKAVLAVIAVKFAGAWNFNLVLNRVPAYLQSVLHYPIAQNGYMMAIIYVSLTISMSGGGIVSDHIIRRQWASKTLVRKLFQLVAIGGSSVSLAAITLVSCDRNAVVGLLVLAMLLYGQVSGGDIPVIADMTSNFPATVIAMANSMSTVAATIVPLVVGAMIESDEESRVLWARVFYLTVAINAIGYVVFLVWGEARVQDWDRESEDRKRGNDKFADLYRNELFNDTKL